MGRKHTMKVVTKRTGLSPHLIRIWERRYEAVQPDRTPAGHRLYSDDDIERLLLLHRATQAGESIGQIARLPRVELALLAASIESETEESAGQDAAHSQNAKYHLELGIESIRNLDAVNLEAGLLRASMALGQQIFLEEALQPLLVQTGEMWNDGSLKVAHEHLASAVIRSLLGSMAVATPSTGEGPLMLATTPMGQLHEFGSLMVSVTAASMGWRTVYLGPNLPAEEIAAAVFQRKANVVALSIVYPSDDPHLNLELKKLARLLATEVKLIVGGRVAESYSVILQEVGAIQISDLKNLKTELARIRKDLKGPSTG